MRTDPTADFRPKDQAPFEKWYKIPHSAPDLPEEAVYGLPESTGLRQTALLP